MIRKLTAPILFAAGLLVTVSAQPQIKFDATTFKIPNIAEGDSVVLAEFKYTNTGNKPLHITNVRVTCGCTVVSYDTIIAPGKTGVIKPQVNTRGFRPGTVNRTVIMTSNAANNQSQTLTIEMQITSPLEVTPVHLHFAGAAEQTVWMATAKTDLKVNSVVLRPHAAGGNTPQWASNVPVNMTHKFTPTDSVRADGYRVYRLDILSPSGGKEPVVGNIAITTNHPAKREVSLVADHH